MGMNKVNETFTAQSSDDGGLAENRTSERMPVKRLLHVPVLGKIFRIILDHSHFFEDDLLFFFDFFRRKFGVVKKIGQERQGLGEVLIENLDVERGRFAAGERIHLAAQGIDLP